MEVIPLGTVQVVVPVEVNRRSHTFVVPATRLKPVGQVEAAAGDGAATLRVTVSAAHVTIAAYFMSRMGLIRPGRPGRGSHTY